MAMRSLNWVKTYAKTIVEALFSNFIDFSDDEKVASENFPCSNLSYKLYICGAYNPIDGQVQNVIYRPGVN